MEVLYPYQVEGGEYLAAHPQALLADEMGLGKSAQAVRAADLVGAHRILVVCPGVARVNWAREFAKFSTAVRPVEVLMTGKQKPRMDGVTVCSYDLLQAFNHLFKQAQWDALILDEAHYLKEKTAKRTKAVYGHSSLAPGLHVHATRVWRLSGTPAPNDASELYTHLKAAGLIHMPYWDYVFRYTTGFSTDYGYKITGNANVKELRAILDRFMLRRKKADVLKDLPPLRWQTVVVPESAMDLSGLDVRRQEDDRLRLALELASGEPESEMATIQRLAGSMATLRHHIGVAKAPAALDILAEDLAAESGKLVVWAIHRQVIEMAAARLREFGVAVIDGRTPANRRQQLVDQFQQDPKCRVLVGQIVAAGTAITLTAACEEAFLEQSWVPAENAQAADRCCRIGQTMPVRARVFSLAGSVDEQVEATLVRKARELAKIL